MLTGFSPLTTSYSTCGEIKWRMQIDAYVFLAFDQPKWGNYSKADGSHFTRLQIPVLRELKHQEPNNSWATCLCPPHIYHTGNNCAIPLLTPSAHSVLPSNWPAMERGTLVLVTALDLLRPFWSTTFAAVEKSLRKSSPRRVVILIPFQPSTNISSRIGGKSTFFSHLTSWSPQVLGILAGPPLIRTWLKLWVSIFIHIPLRRA